MFLLLQQSVSFKHKILSEYTDLQLHFNTQCLNGNATHIETSVICFKWKCTKYGSLYPQRNKKRFISQFRLFPLCSIEFISCKTDFFCFLNLYITICFLIILSLNLTIQIVYLASQTFSSPNSEIISKNKYFFLEILSLYLKNQTFSIVILSLYLKNQTFPRNSELTNTTNRCSVEDEVSHYCVYLRLVDDVAS